MDRKNYRHLTFVDSKITFENDKIYRNYEYKENDGTLFVDKREISLKTFKDTTEKKSFLGVIHSLMLAAHYHLERVNDEKDLETIKQKGKQLNHFIDKLILYCKKGNISESELSEFLTSAAYQALAMAKNKKGKLANDELMQKALDTLVENSKLKAYFITQEEELE